MKAVSENSIRNACQQWLELKGAMVIRINSGGMFGSYKGKARFLRFNSEPGCSDILCCLPGGTFLAVEVKRPWGRRTPTDKLNAANRRLAQQQAFLDAVRRRGGVGVMVSSVEELEHELTKAGVEW